jgi:hypothetical protein
MTASYTSSLYGATVTWVAYVNGEPVIESPQLEASPVVTGTPLVGNTLSTTDGDWLGAEPITFTYLWLRNGVPIGGATSQTYVVAVADIGSPLSCQVTATNSFGNNSATSNSTSNAYADAPTNTVAPAVTGTPIVGGSLSSTSGTWTGTATITYAYQWLRNGSTIASATASTYTPVTADIGNPLSCRVTASNPGGDTNATSNSTANVTEAAPVNTVAPVASGYVYAGKTLSTTNGTWTSIATPTYAYQWKRNGTNVSNGTNSTYAVVTADEGQSITCSVTATNPGGSTSQVSNTLTNWTPTSLTLTNWYDYADVPTMTYDGGTGAISQINDKSGNVRNATQGTGIRQPILTVSAVNSLYAALYDGSNDRMDFSTSGDLSTFTVIVIAKPARIRQYDAFLDSAAGATNELTCEQSDLSRIDYYDYNVGRRAISSGTISTSAPFVLKWSYDTTTMRSSVNNAGAGSDTQASGVLKQACSMGGDHGSGGFYMFSGYLCEVFIAASVLTSQNFTDIQTYAQNKWGTA